MCGVRGVVEVDGVGEGVRGAPGPEVDVVGWAWAWVWCCASRGGVMLAAGWRTARWQSSKRVLLRGAAVAVVCAPEWKVDLRLSNELSKLDD